MTKAIYLFESISDVINYLKSHLDETDITLYEGATDQQIAELENSAGVKLPNDVKQFYKFSNGFISDEDQFRIVPLNELLSHDRGQNILYIGEYLCYCDTWALIINPENNCYQINHPDERGFVLTNSFSEFLSRFFIGGVFEQNGLYDWRDKIKSKETE
ncbi:SMI1/KNR4 family protein [Mucilaginibacter rubeus]|uniref:SMI1/KNR4 family protein n=1 Tax=Mucilaginibacter rubeus TaxID=2027860 RepID=A0AAE6JK09_9SPHI|nr:MULTISPECIES: SMI1/KNR4 family protein [Mucilaginibacter]QEM06032.1 SMI1/KNR4 family protein [Mucilaginibacter rubeus]QEM18613.1 SMI1/KNR4 family protein [Mucilaginibacter gossypii]QTE44845.1 SMI1/KNR4 family protein [Mucilaginibacter rubeus]QTE51443.1 SMI1/KNR4 family protein [Mucilaginibacter rubeus]QTE56529.1 SMI1/KNR4 family protein [Mucilaginibacter rubeus]